MKNDTLSTIKKVSLVSALVNFLLAAFKVAIGYIGHSQALIADGIHSLSDLLSDGLVVVTAKLGQERPDRTRPYGHGRIETLGTIIMAILIIAIAVGLAIDSFHRLSNVTRPLPSLWVLVVAAVSVIANEGLFRYSIFHSKRIRSALLKSNAWHNRGDAFVSIIVLISAATQYSGIHYVDLIAALVIAAMIFRMGAKMISNCVKELIDTAADKETIEKIDAIIRQVPGVVDIHHLRTRFHSGKILLDAHLQVNNRLTVSEGHLIGDRVMDALYKDIDDLIDITIHIDAENDDHIPNDLIMSLPTREMIQTHLNAHAYALPHFDDITEMYLHYVNGTCSIEIIFPANTNMKNPNEVLTQYKTMIEQMPRVDNVSIFIQHH